MNKNEYIDRLAASLDRYEIENVIDVLADYEQIIDEILLDNNNDFNLVLTKLGYPEILAMEIASEFGFKLKDSEKNKEFNTKNSFETKRKKSNIAWNIILALYTIIQLIALTVIILSVIFISYFGFDSRLNTNFESKNNAYVIESTICSNDDCLTNRIELPKYNMSYHRKDRFIENNTITTVSDFPIGFITVVFSSFLALFMIVAHFLIYRNVKKVIYKNNEYNRRRYYE